MGKALVSNIMVPLSFVVVQKPLLWLVSRLCLARSPSFLSPPPGSVRWHRYCSILLAGWHPTAPHRLAPYCYIPAGTLLLIVGWHPLCPVGPLAFNTSNRLAPPRLRLVVV